MCNNKFITYNSILLQKKGSTHACAQSCYSNQICTVNKLKTHEKTDLTLLLTTYVAGLHIVCFAKKNNVDSRLPCPTHGFMPNLEAIFHFSI